VQAGRDPYRRRPRARREGDLETFVVLRRSAWQTHDELEAARARATAGVERAAETIRWLRSYDIAETDGKFGWICVYEAATPEAIRHHATAAALPIDEILKVAGAFVERLCPAATATRRGGIA
jgi:hypothetical protein